MTEIAQTLKMDADNYRYHCSMENFIMDEYSICREERQYAVFLYNILRKYGKKQSREKLTGEEKDNILEIFEACGIEADCDIEHVFYEATFMRDFFERERRYSAITKHHDNPATVFLQQSYKKEEKTKTDFNRRLIEYAFKSESENPPKMNMENEDRENKYEDDAYLRYNLGRNLPKGCKDLEKIEKAETVREKIRAMMNAKPDIAVIYKKSSQRYLLFIECKCESSEAVYNGVNQNGGNRKKEKLRQCSIQYDVARFLCDHYLNKELSKSDLNAIHLSPIMKSDKKSKIIKFTRTNKKTKKRNAKEESKDGNILIKTLIDCNNKIFEENAENNGEKEGVPHE